MEYNGLSSAEVLERTKKGLSNKASKSNTKTIPIIFVENIFSVFNIIIFSIVAILFFFYMQTNDERLLMDTIGVLFVNVINTFLAVYQEIKSRIALNKVSLMLKKNVTVIRNGKEESINYTDVVVDDCIVLGRGDQIIVDGKVLQSNRVEVDESSVTGESVHLLKQKDDYLYSGTFCVSGNGIYVAEKIGDECYANKISKMAKKYKFNASPLEKKINFIVKILFAIALVLVILEIIFGADNGLLEIDFIRKTVAIVISLIPQGLVLMVSVTFAIGVFRISKIGAIIQKLNAVETFSNIKLICMDKTGTITQNNLAVSEISFIDNKADESLLKKLIGTFAANSSDANETIMALKALVSFESSSRTDEFPFSSEWKFSAQALSIPGQEEISGCFILGAYDILLNKISETEREKFQQALLSKNLSDFRNLLFGRIKINFKLESLKENFANIEIEPICVISITDQVRLDAAETINLFKEKGIDFKILSGDASGSIKSVLKQLNLNVNPDEIITGGELNSIDEKSFYSTIKDKIVFARLQPEQKLRIIKSFRKEGISTAMIGDGVNDIPAIKEADIGIAMEEGSQSTKEIADIILLKNKFSLLPAIFDEGNKIMNTASSISKLFLTKNFMVIFLTLFSLVFLWEFPLTPTRISLLNIFAIGIPAFILASTNRNTERVNNFFGEVISFVLISALVIVLFSYLGVFLVEKFFIVDNTDIQLIILTIMILTTFTNFYIITERGCKEEKKIYYSYIIIFPLLFILFAASNLDLSFLNFMKNFYDVDYIRTELWLVIVPVCITASITLIFMQKLRKRLIM